MIIVRPTNIELQDWADTVCLDLDVYGVVARLQSEDWQGWAAQFLNNVEIGKNVPNPYNFADWQEWAQRFCDTVV